MLGVSAADDGAATSNISKAKSEVFVMAFLLGARHVVGVNFFPTELW
jgi:hypothetical protein